MNEEQKPREVKLCEREENATPSGFLHKLYESIYNNTIPSGLQEFQITITKF